MKRTALIAGLVVHALACQAGPDSLKAGLQTYTVSAYCHCAKCCGQANQPAANGHQPVLGVTVAGPRSIPLGTHVWIEGIGERVVNDRLAKRYDDRFDLFLADHETARQFGLQQLKVTILP